MQVSLDQKETQAFLILRQMIEEAPTRPNDFFDWIAARLVEVHKEPADVDYVQALRRYSRDFNRIQSLLRI